MSYVGYNPDNDKDDILLEEIKDDPSPKEKLFDFLSKAGKEDYIDNIYPMFNDPFILKETLMSLISTTLQEEWEKFNKIIGQDIFQCDSLEFVHYVNLGMSAAEITNIKKRWYIFPDQKEVKFIQINCPVHNKDCMMMEYNVAFLSYLFLHADSKDPTIEDECSSKIQKLNVLKTHLEEEDEVFDLVSPVEERKLTEDFDVAEFKASTIIDVNSTPLSRELVTSDFVILGLPSFFINGKNYILLSHIQKLCNLREDYALAIIADMCNSTKDFLDIENEHKEELLSLDSEVTENFVEAPNALSLCFQKAKEGEASLLIEEEFIALQKSIPIFGMRRN